MFYEKYLNLTFILSLTITVRLFFNCVCPVMKSLNSPQDYWQVDRVSTELKIHKLQEELERVTLENSRQLERSGVR